MDISKNIKQLLLSNGSKLYLEKIMDSIDNHSQLIDFIHRYTVFNGNFAGGVANLAGAFHIRNDLFSNRNEPIAACADIGHEIASHIFFAAEDEYACRYNNERVTHRSLGQYLLKETINYFGLSAEEFKLNYKLNKETVDTLKTVESGYKLNRVNEEIDLYHGLGFHLGSEILADEEFNILDTYLKNNHMELVTHLQNANNGRGQTAYHWIKIHTYVEDEHFDISVKAANILLENYIGSMSKKAVYHHIINGFIDFANLQRFFFGNILSNPCLAMKPDPSSRNKYELAHH